MSNVFIGGSRKASRLNATVKARLDEICSRNMAVLVGDANGVDKAVQSHLAQRGYRNVTVYCSNHACRNNLGGWDVRSVSTDARRGTRSFHEAKDRAMAHDASYGFMIWDGRSQGTLNNLVVLLEAGTKVLVYVTSETTFHTLRESSELEPFLRDCSCPNQREYRVIQDVRGGQLFE